jgi:outer membrane lipoprotein-sorting protein
MHRDGVPAPVPFPDATSALSRSERLWQRLNSYQVPVTINAHVRVGILSLPVRMTGTQYFRAPDQQALHLDNPPSFARSLGNTLSTMGTPQTWLRDYAVGNPAVEPHGHHTAYVLVGTPNHSGRVRSMTMWVSATTYVVESVAFAYNNGASLKVTFTHHHGISQYHLPRTAMVAAKFPGYSGDATINYGTYVVNQPIPDSVFLNH